MIAVEATVVLAAAVAVEKSLMAIYMTTKVTPAEVKEALGRIMKTVVASSKAVMKTAAVRPQRRKQ